MYSTGEVDKDLDRIVSFTLKQLVFFQHYPTESISLRGTLTFSTMVYLALQPFLVAYENFYSWNFLYRVASIETLMITSSVLLASIEIFILSNRFSSMVDLSTSSYTLKVVTDSTPSILREKMDLVKKITSERIKTSRIILVTLSLIIAIRLTELIVHLFHIKSSPKSPPRPFSVDFLFTFPPYIPTFIETFFKLSLLFFYLHYVLVIICNVYLFLTLSISNVIGDMKLFHLNIAEVDGYFERVLESDDYKSASDSVRRQMENKLRQATSNAVKHHQSIYRKIQMLSYGSTFRIFFTNSHICLQIVFGITIFLKGEFIIKLKYGLMLIALSVIEFLFNEIGQLLENEGEEIRMTLYGSNWFVKPSWYRKALQIMMLRSNRLPRLGFLNIFSLNRKNKTEVMRAAYGYFNFLNELS